MIQEELKNKIVKLTDIKLNEIEILTFRNNEIAVTIDLSDRKENYIVTYTMLQKLSKLLNTDDIQIETNKCDYIESGFVLIISIDAKLK